MLGPSVGMGSKALHHGAFYECGVGRRTVIPEFLVILQLHVVRTDMNKASNSGCKGHSLREGQHNVTFWDYLAGWVRVLLSIVLACREWGGHAVFFHFRAVSDRGCFRNVQR